MKYPGRTTAVSFLRVGYNILVYLQGFFLHCVNTRQQEMLCHSLFLSGETEGLVRIEKPGCLASKHFLYLLSFCVRLPQQPQGPDAGSDLPCQSADMTVLHAEEEPSSSILDLKTGRIYSTEVDPAYLLQILRSDTKYACLLLS